ncbi:sensor domain-containing diguanylate cyclase [Sphingomonas crusticola]|uniref:GGDEF domain-containing protein n=1 Tax=Sphingomonas crusticola TaxID=1697973 RepID=UPI000E252F25|nr:GGDEF domain-containing protein [Sphingomonas crusticola]
MLFHTPDIPTLRLCSLLATLSYATIFIVLWGRRRNETYLLHWGLSSALYAVALFGFEFSQSALSGALNYGTVALSDFLLLMGMRRFDGKQAFRPWMLIPIAAAMAAVLIPFLAIPDRSAATMTSHIAGAVALGSCMVVCACAILAGGPRDVGLPRRIVAVAMLAYGPTYLISIWIEIRGPAAGGTLDLLPMLQDQVLLGVLNLGLLATPWERALRELKESARRDPLTGVWNRTALKHREQVLALPANSLFLIDIDHFKAINDTFGHAAGDSVLLTFAARVEALARTRNGMFVRLGGDEFVLVAPTTDDADALTLAEQVRAVPDPELSGLPPYSLCIGMARVHEGETSLSLAMARADRSLYRAKAGGRDQVAA